MRPNRQIRTALLLFLLLAVSGGCKLMSPATADRQRAATLKVTLYPGNELADRTGTLTVPVTLLTMARGRFAFDYQGEAMVGEIRRVSGDTGRSVAVAHGPGGRFVHCDFRTGLLGTGGTCVFANGARYEMRIDAV